MTNNARWYRREARVPTSIIRSGNTGLFYGCVAQLEERSSPERDMEVQLLPHLPMKKRIQYYLNWWQGHFLWRLFLIPNSILLI